LRPLKMEDFLELPISSQLEKLVNALEEDEPDSEQLVTAFVHKYSPDTSLQLIKENSRAIKESGILDTVLEKLAAGPYKNFLMFMRILSLIDNYEQEIYAADGITKILSSMKTNEDELDAQILGCKALAHLSLDEVVREAMGEEGSIEHLFKIMSRYEDSAPLQIVACSALINLSFDSEENKAKIGSEEGVKTLVSIMQRHLNHEKVQLLGATVLRNISTLEGVRDTVVQSGAIPALIRAMEVHKHVASVQLTCMWCFINLFFTSETNKRLFGEGNGVEVVIDALNLHRENAEVVKAAAICLLQLSRLATNRVKIAAHQGAVALIAALQSHLRDWEVVEILLRALERVSLNEDTRKSLLKSEYVSVLCDVFKIILDAAQTPIDSCIHLLSTLSRLALTREGKEVLNTQNLMALLKKCLDDVGDKSKQLRKLCTIAIQRLNVPSAQNLNISEALADVSNNTNVTRNKEEEFAFEDLDRKLQLLSEAIESVEEKKFTEEPKSPTQLKAEAEEQKIKALVERERLKRKEEKKTTERG